jgi:predicted nucleotidyltransferase
MRIEASQTIAGQPALMIRKLMRRAHGHGWTIEIVEDILGVGKRTAKQVLRELESEGYISKKRLTDGRQFWENTVKGNALGMATMAKPTKRAKAEQKLNEFLERVKKVNEEDYFLFEVKKVVLFGSYISSKESVNDIDIAIELVCKVTNRGRYEELARDRVKEAHQNGRTFSNSLDEIFWPQTEVRRYLKARSRVISLHDTFELSSLQCESKVIYENGNVIP